MSTDHEKLAAALKGASPTSCCLCDNVVNADDVLTVVILGDAKHVCHATCVSDLSEQPMVMPPEEIDLRGNQ